MIKVFADRHKLPGVVYVEDTLSAHDVHKISKDDLKLFVKDMVMKYGCVHTCYPDFISRVGRFIVDYGKRWCGQEFVVYTTIVAPGGIETSKKKKHRFDTTGRVCEWPLGYL